MKVRALAIELPAGDEPPTEFRILRRGLNPNVNGPPILFDDAAAAAVMAEYASHGVRVVIDLDHGVLKPAIRPDSHDSRGDCCLDLRDGDLWACDAKWAPDGARRLREKTQRFISPLIAHDDQNRVVRLINLGLVAMPALDFAPPLVAASVEILARRYRAASVSCITMDPKLIQEALDALIAGDQAKATEILKSLVVAAATGGAAEPPAPAGSEPVAEAADLPPADPAAPPADDKSKAYADDLAALRADVDALKAGGVKEVNVKRCALVAQLVALGAETPATAWEKTKAGEPDTSKPVKRLSDESIDGMAARVKALGAGRPRSATATPPARTSEVVDAGGKEVQTSRGVVALSAAEVKNCTEYKITVEQYAENKAIREAARG